MCLSWRLSHVISHQLKYNKFDIWSCENCETKLYIREPARLEMYRVILILVAKHIKQFGSKFKISVTSSDMNSWLCTHCWDASEKCLPPFLRIRILCINRTCVNRSALILTGPVRHKREPNWFQSRLDGRDSFELMT